MATFTSNSLSLVEVAKRKAPDGTMAEIAEVLEEQNEILQDAVWYEANDTFSNVTTRRSQEPSGSFRKLNQGVGKESSKTTTIIDTVAILETRAENDIEVINAFPDPVRARNDENIAFIRGLSKTAATKMIYGNSSTTPEEFTGIAPRLDTLATSKNVLNAGGTGADLASIYVIDWGRQGVYMTFPKNSKVGLGHTDLGIETVTDSNGNKLSAYVDKFTWKLGMVVRNDKSIGRIANIETTGTSNIFNEDDLITLLNRMTKGPGRRIYVNETIMTQMEIKLKDKTNTFFSKADGLAPGPVLTFKGVPIRLVEKILDTETAIS
jgi:hypothetical protein